MKRAVDPHYRHRFPAEIISHAVWLYFTFCLSFRDVELMLAEHGVGNAMLYFALGLITWRNALPG